MMKDEHLCLVMYEDPVTGVPFLGDQYGRRLEGVTSFSIEKNIHGKRKFKVSINDVAHLYAKNIPLLIAKHEVTTPKIEIALKTDEDDVKKVELGGKQNLIMVKIPSGTHDTTSYSDFAKRLGAKLGPDHVVIAVSETVELEVVSLVHSGEALQKSIESRKRNAKWDF